MDELFYSNSTFTIVWMSRVKYTFRCIPSVVSSSVQCSHQRISHTCRFFLNVVHVNLENKRVHIDP
jgi:hypothetical protein